MQWRRWSRAPRTRSCASRTRSRRRCASAPRRARSSRSRTARTSTTSPGSSTRLSDRFRITHAGSFFGKRDPRPFLTALRETGLDIQARFLGDFRSADREWAEQLGLGDRLELIPYAPRRRSLELQRDSEALLLLIPEAGGRGKGVLSGKVFEYLAAERPDPGPRASRRRGGVPDQRDGRRRGGRPGRRRRDHGRSARSACTLAGRCARPAPPLSDEWRRRVSRRTRVEELAQLLERLA